MNDRHVVAESAAAVAVPEAVSALDGTGRGPSRRGAALGPVALVVAGGLSVQFGAAVAVLLMPKAGALGVVTLRLAAAAVVMLVVCSTETPRALARRLGHRGGLRHRDGRDEHPLLPGRRPHPAGRGRHPGGAGAARPVGRRLPPPHQPRLGGAGTLRRRPAQRWRLRPSGPRRSRVRPRRGRHVGGVHPLQRPDRTALPAGGRTGPGHGRGSRPLAAPRHHGIGLEARGPVHPGPGHRRRAAQLGPSVHPRTHGPAPACPHPPSRSS